jgi:transposase
MFFCGIDWSDKDFAIVIVDQDGAATKSFRIKNNAEGFTGLINRVRTVTTDINNILFAIETPNSPLVDFLMDKGYTVYAINPKAVDRYRDRYRVSKAKDDFFDGMVLANIIRTDRNRHKPIAPASDLVRELKILTQDREKLVQTKTKFINQLRSCLKAYYPEACRLFSDFASSSAFTFLKLFPTWEDLNRKSEKQILQLLKKQKMTNPSLLKKIIHHSHIAPIPIDPVVKRAKARQMIAIVEQLITLYDQLEEYDREIERLLDKHPDKDIFLSLPGAGANLASRILSHLGDDRTRYQCVGDVRPLAGVAPVTKQSGNYMSVRFRYGCRKPFRNALQLFAFCSLNRSQWAYRYYQKHPKMGKTHNQALRLLADKSL